MLFATHLCGLCVHVQGFEDGCARWLQLALPSHESVTTAPCVTPHATGVFSCFPGLAVHQFGSSNSGATAALLALRNAASCSVYDMTHRVPISVRSLLVRQSVQLQQWAEHSGGSALFGIDTSGRLHTVALSPGDMRASCKEVLDEGVSIPGGTRVIVCDGVAVCVPPSGPDVMVLGLRDIAVRHGAPVLLPNEQALLADIAAAEK